MDNRQFREEAHRLVDWMADYFEKVEDFPVKPDVAPGSILKKLPGRPPEQGESFETIIDDFKRLILPGMTHWQSPSFMGYFPANNSFPSVLAEMLTATLGAQCMSWVTSPAATELEEQVMDWLRGMVGLPDTFEGVIQDTASTSTLCALLMSRERKSGFATNEEGFVDRSPMAVYGSAETHSSIEKDVKIAGFGRRYLRKIGVDDTYAMDPEKLEEAIRDDLERGITPCCAIATLGTTGSTAIDPLEAIGRICREYDLFLHVDAAYAGSALVLPEFRSMLKGIEYVDAFVFNPHKWMFTNFDCSAFFVRDEELLVRTFEIIPEYLKTDEDKRVKNYRDWGIQLGRRFRALKLWFVIRAFGVEGIRDTIRDHIALARELKQEIEEEDFFELLAPTPLNLINFRYHPPEVDDTEELNRLNRRLLEAVNSSGELFITHTKLNGSYSLRIVIGQTRVQRKHVRDAWRLIRETAAGLTE